MTGGTDLTTGPQEPGTSLDRHIGLYRTLYKLRVLLLAPSIAVMTLCRWFEYENDLITFTVGPVLFLLGLTIRVWAQMHLRYRLKTKTTLTMTGPYVFVRNPIYIGNTIILLGVCVMSEVSWFLPILLLNCAVVYTFAVRYEEAHLSRKYGTPYLEYLRQVPRWIPRIPVAAPRQRHVLQDFLYPSIASEAHNLFYLAIPVLKEIISRL